LKTFVEIILFINTTSKSNQIKSNQIKSNMATTLSLPLPRIPAFIVKYIATFMKRHGNQNVEILISLFKAFTLGIEYDDQSTRDYKKNVWQNLSVIMYDALDEWYTLSDNAYPYALSPLDLAWVYEMTFADHYAQANNWDGDEFLKITDLLEQTTTLCDNENIMGMVSYPLNIKELKFINLLEKALMQNRGDLLRFIYENAYSPIMAFYLYAKHNHIDYHRTDENSLANDEGLLDLLISQGGYQKELLSLAITGLFENDYIYVKKYNEIQTLEKHGVMPNSEVVNDILCNFPEIRNETIPYYMKPQIEAMALGEESRLPLEIWQQYKNTFNERRFLKDFNPQQHIITITKNEFIGKLLT
jgi:hypothetical protein